MNLIFAVDNNYSIGYDGDMLFHLKTDLKRFKDITMNNIVIMGRKTLESLPKGLPLPNRINVVLSLDKDYKKDGIVLVNDLGELDETLKTLNPNGDLKEFLIGGGNLVKQLYDKCDYAYITEVDKEYINYDTQIPNIREDDNWKLIKASDINEEDGLRFKFKEYARISK